MKDKNFQFDLVSPERVLYSAPASMVLVPGEFGQFGVLVGHAPMLVTVKAGVLYIHTSEGEVKRIFVSQGFADVSETHCSVMVEAASEVSEIEAAEAEKELAAAKSELSYATEELAVEHALQKIEQGEEKRRAISA